MKIRLKKIPYVLNLRQKGLAQYQESLKFVVINIRGHSVKTYQCEDIRITTLMARRSNMFFYVVMYGFSEKLNEKSKWLK